jgi:antitoxin (DNA-binding transcriptional repressor) of toxin-antitoxin stability system
MHTSNIASAKEPFQPPDRFGEAGQTVLITERNKPVATLQPVSRASTAGVEALHSSGLLTPPGRSLDVTAFLAAPRAALKSGNSLAQAVLQEREEGR